MSDKEDPENLEHADQPTDLKKRMQELEAIVDTMQKNHKDHIDWHDATEIQAQKDKEAADKFSREFYLRLYLGLAVWMFTIHTWGNYEHMFLSFMAALVPAVGVQYLVNPIRRYINK